MKQLVIILQLFLSYFSANCQNRGNIWCFGDSCLINFNTQPPTTNNSIIRTRGTACSISDSSGNLVFYCGAPNIPLWLTGGSPFVGIVYNKNHQFMENGDSLAGELWYNEMIIVPDPNYNSRYYLFHLEIAVFNQGLYYSIVDLSYNGGLGKVISKNNQLLSGYMSDGVSAIKHGNGRDWWIFVRRSDALTSGQPNNDFYIYLIDTSGIHSMPLQSIGSLNATNNSKITFNPTGEKFALTNLQGLNELFDFDRCTGVVSNPVNIEQASTSNSPHLWGAEFSASGQYLYTSTSLDTSYIFQYDTYAPNIKASKKIIDNFSEYDYAGGALKRGPDGKIYYASAWYDGTSFNFPYPDTSYNMYNMNLGVINYPDSPGVACDFQPFSFYLGGKRNYWGLPNNPNYDLPQLYGSSCDTLHVNVNEISKQAERMIKIFPNPASSEINFYSENFRAGELRVIDGLGKVILENHLNNGSAFVSGLESGVYYVQLLENGIIQSKEKFIIIE